MSPDHTQWHGFYEVAKTFYTEFAPEAEALLPGVTADHEQPLPPVDERLEQGATPTATRVLQEEVQPVKNINFRREG
jgi:hypothetical protein